MAVLNPAAYGIYGSGVALQHIVQQLNLSGFNKEDICMMLSPRHPLATAMREANVLHAERGVGAAAAGTMAWLMKFGAVLIPTVGLFIRSAKFLPALMTSEPAPIKDSNGLVELGFSTSDAARIGTELSNSGVLLYISGPETSGLRRAVQLMQLTGAFEAATMEPAGPRRQAIPPRAVPELAQQAAA
jgi:hypothetical protein